MSDMVIQVEGLSKKYRIQHQAEGQRYSTLRDELTNRFKNLFVRKARARVEPSSEDFWALRDVSFEVKQGEVVGIIGRNGAGKSTLLKILSRITEPTQGRVRLKGRVASLLEVGTGFHPELTGRENIYLNGAILGMSRVEIKRNFDEIVAFAEVEKFLDTPVKRYSSGMYVRLAFAVAAHLEPEILIVDEVLAVGDAEFQKKCLGKIRSISSGEGRTILFVSHNMPTIRQLCGSCILLEKGRIAKEGTPADITSWFLNKQIDQEDYRVDLNKKVRPNSTTGDLRFTGLEINNNRPLTYGSPCSFKIKALASCSLSDVIIGVGFRNQDGARILSIDSDLVGVVFEVQPNLPINIEVVIDKLLLHPGIYHFDLACRSGRISQDYLESFLSLEVHADTQTHTSLIGYQNDIRYPAKWEQLTPE